MLKKILLAYDGSPGSQDAARYAVELAQANGAHVTVLTVGGPLFGAALLAREEKEVMLPQMDRHEYERIADEGVAMLLEQGVSCSKHFRWLDPADEIISEAREGNYDLIVMGHRSARTSMRREAGLPGSAAIKVINCAPCSVLVVRPPAGVEGPDEQQAISKER